MTDPIHPPIGSAVFRPGKKLTLQGPMEKMRVYYNGMELPVVAMEHLVAPHQQYQELYDIGGRMFRIPGGWEPGVVTLTLMFDELHTTDNQDGVETSSVAVARAGLDL